VKRLLASTATAALALGAALVATAAPAAAHTPVVDADCSSVEVGLWAYADADQPNELTVTVDGEVVKEERFGRSIETSVSLDPARDHTWEVEVDAADGRRFDWRDAGTTTACPTDEDQGQVGVYVYPKLDASKPAAWENSGAQKLVTGHEAAVPADPWAMTWTVAPLDLAAVREVVGDDVPVETLCSAWGVQQDLINLSGHEYELPGEIEYSADGHHKGDFPAGSLVAWEHQDLRDLLPAGACAPGRPQAAPPAAAPVLDATPVAPAAAAVCGASIDDVVLPEDSARVRYTATSEGVVAEAADGVTLTDVPAGYVLAEDGRRAVLPAEAVLPAAADCALVPGAIEAVCEADVPYLGYEVALPEGVEADGDTPLTITFLHPRGGEDYVVGEQPLSGRVLWPGASATEPKQWPGFALNEDGSYTPTEGNYAWTREGVQVLFEVNPSYSTVVEYPPASSECANPPVAPIAAEDVTLVSAEDEGSRLASTGATVAGAAAFAALLVGGGVLVFWLRRRVHS
jgi:hypothetical protein